MKYCPTCKQRAPDEASTCTKCGGPVRRMGAAPPEPASPPPSVVATASKPIAAPPVAPIRPVAAIPPLPPKAVTVPAPAAVVAPPPLAPPRPAAPPVSPSGPLLGATTFELSGQPALTMELQGLQHAVAEGRRRVWLLGLAAAALMLLLLMVLLWRHFHEVFQYAEIGEVELRSTAGEAGVEIRYIPKSAGRLQITRIGVNQTEQLTEFIESGNSGFRNGEFLWDGVDTPTAKFSVKYRRGWSLHDQIWSPPRAGTASKE